MRIVIVGAGIGGLATALSLHAAGFRDIGVYERAEVLRPLGVGINLLPYAVRELTELGLGDRTAALGVPPGTLTCFNRQQGPEQVMVLAHERAPGGFAHIHDVVSPEELTEIATGYKKAAGFHPDALNARPSLTPPSLDPMAAGA